MTSRADDSPATAAEAPRRRGRPTRRSGVADLSHAEIIQASLECVRSDGLKALTIRKVATLLQVSPMALYQHFPDKRRLNEAVVDAALSEVRQQPRGDEPWTDWLVSQALESMRVFQVYPGTAAHILDHGIFGYGHQSMRIADQIFAVLLEAGFDQRSALKIYTTCLCFVAGLIHTNVELPVGISAREFPAIGALTRQAVKGLDAEHIAEYGLRCLLTGVAAASIEST
ncbi:hypothetical protein A5692_12040 [Mycobacterium sp. E342]|uniref:TetR/AcrR family transcriptional regulator n=1 Tax=unclassified Mycobacterium TaxID=2642494 RepID=UPI000801E077|nr:MULTISPECIES: TetR family transcriptional regulator [unclassified Mycobacterium]OBH13960.1 hypothetical protein A9X04_15310 [Mycobacterium sp. E3247]OBH35332.1 hypothetical protein A5692_12040 [Mycobacterium sp. E342]